MLDFAFLFLEESPPSRLMMIRDNSSEDARGNSNVIEFIRYVSKSSDELSLTKTKQVQFIEGSIRIVLNVNLSNHRFRAS